MLVASRFRRECDGANWAPSHARSFPADTFAAFRGGNPETAAGSSIHGSNKPPGRRVRGMIHTPARWSHVAFLVTFGFLTGMFFSASTSCGGGGGGGAGAAPVFSSDMKIHVSSVGGAISVPLGAFGTVRSIAFTPSTPNDVIVYVQAAGTWTNTSGAGNANLWMRVNDSTGQPYSVSIPSPALTLVASSGSYRIQGSIVMDRAFMPSNFPSSSYTIELLVISDGSWAGLINSSQFKIMVQENPTVSSPSPNIAG